MKIGIEVELKSADYDQYCIADESGLDFFNFKLLDGEDEDGIGVKMSEEYYSQTIEYNFTPFNISKLGINKCKTFLEKQMDIWSLSLSSIAPAFVGTHIHIFNKKYIKVDENDKLLKHILYFISNNLDGLEDNSLKRLFSAHQLWTYWSNQNNGEWINKINSLGYEAYYYRHNAKKKKYSPIIVSPGRRGGKPRSLEIRIIPNEYIFNGKAYELMKLIENGEIYNTPEIEVKDFIDKVYNNIASLSKHQLMRGFIYGELTFKRFLTHGFNNTIRLVNQEDKEKIVNRMIHIFDKMELNGFVNSKYEKEYYKELKEFTF